jgi:hypothetical protein
MDPHWADINHHLRTSSGNTTEPKREPAIEGLGWIY